MYDTPPITPASPLVVHVQAPIIELQELVGTITQLVVASITSIHGVRSQNLNSKKNFEELESWGQKNFQILQTRWRQKIGSRK